MIIGTLGYFIVPLDAIPDMTPVVGYGDDCWGLMRTDMPQRHSLLDSSFQDFRLLY